MRAAVLNIVEKVKPFEVVPAQLENFVVEEVETQPAQIILDHPHISLYCLDDASRRAIFVETPPDVDLLQAPFYYDAQYQHAQRLYALSYEDFHQLAQEVEAANLILIHSIGRCGSTVISQAFSTVAGVRSLSEPDVYTQIHMLRHVDKTRDAEFAQLLQSCTRLLGKGTPTLVIKFRGMCIHIGDLLYQVLPQATNLFLYRHAESWARSMGIAMATLEERRTPSVDVPMYRRAIAPLSIPFAQRHGRESSRVEMTALMWLSMLDSYLKLCDAGMPFLAIRYEDIQMHPKDVLAAIFDYCGLSQADIDTAFTVFAKDSQAGSVLSRASRQERLGAPLDEVDYAQMSAVLQEHPVIQSPDFILPNTFNVGD